MDILRKDEDEAARLMAELGIEEDGSYTQREVREIEEKVEDADLSEDVKERLKVKIRTIDPKRIRQERKLNLETGEVTTSPKGGSAFEEREVTIPDFDRDRVTIMGKDKEGKPQTKTTFPKKKRKKMRSREIERTYDSLGKSIDDSWLQVWVWYSDDIMGGLDSWTTNLFKAEKGADDIEVELAIQNPFKRSIMETSKLTSKRLRPTREEFDEFGGRGRLRSQHLRKFQEVAKEYDETLFKAIKESEPKDEILSDEEMARRQARGRKAKEGRPDGGKDWKPSAEDYKAAEPLSSEKAPVSFRSQLLEPYTIIRRFFDSVNSLLGGIEQTSKVERVTEGTGKRSILARKKKQKQQKAVARHVQNALKNFSGGNERQAGQDIEKVDVDTLVLIQKFLTRGKVIPTKEIKDAFLENPQDAKWDHENKQWVSKKTGESALRMYGDRNSFVLFRSILLQNKKKLMPSRKSQGQILQIMEDFKNPEFDLSALDNPQRRIGPMEAPLVDARGFPEEDPVRYPQRKDKDYDKRSKVKTKFTMTELLGEVTEWMQGEDKTIPLHPSLAKSYRKLLIRLVEKLRTDSLKGKTENLSEDLEVIEFLYGVLTHMGRSRTINDVMLSRVEEVAEKEGKEIDWYRDFNLPPMLGDEQPSGEEE